MVPRGGSLLQTTYSFCMLSLQFVLHGAHGWVGGAAWPGLARMGLVTRGAVSTGGCIMTVAVLATSMHKICMASLQGMHAAALN